MRSITYSSPEHVSSAILTSSKNALNIALERCNNRSLTPSAKYICRLAISVEMVGAARVGNEDNDEESIETVGAVGASDDAEGDNEGEGESACKIDAEEGEYGCTKESMSLQESASHRLLGCQRRLETRSTQHSDIYLFKQNELPAATNLPHQTTRLIGRSEL